jgi:hypothetical protein
VDILGYHIPSVIGVGAAFTSVYAAFAKFDADQSDENRKFVREWLLGLRVDDRRWAQFFKELFTKIFGERHLSAKCFRRSASLTAALLVAIWTYAYIKEGQEAVTELRQSYGVPSDMPGVLLFAMAGLGWMIFAIFADYLSLWKTRTLLTRPNLLSSGPTGMAVVVGDALATIVIFLTIVIVPNYTVAFLTHDDVQIADLVAGMTDTIADSITRALLFAPLFTSAWLWVYLIVAYAMRLATHLPSWLRPLSKVMDFEHHPVRTIGYVAASVSAVIVGIMTVV